ncbi:unnamed protein product [Adineta steineri]|uniref:Uncharacterized protein n=2 Tax=Adineta steineri TaxID=433720 RepID=A0A818UYX1_9BILA|nr:unnamed protein product [Adineta steineri]CAF3707475.1 unnamed protein product [Adineta steineri]
MSKNIRQKITRAIQTTFRSSPQKKLSSSKSKISSCCSVSKPKDYEFISYQPKQSSTRNNDYIDLSECHSWSSLYSKDSGISSDTNISSISDHHFQQLQSTKTHADDSCSLSRLSNLSSIPHDHMNISNFDITGWYSIPQSYECCHCQCHHHHMSNNSNVSDNEVNNYLYIPEQCRTKRTKNQMFPYIL